jgi:mono/diheme cytochrome c family protein
MNHGRVIFGGAALTATLLLAACGGGAAATETSTTPSAGSAGGEATTADASATTTPDGEADSSATGATGASAEMIAAGGERFEAVCGLCHPGGEEDSGPSIRDIHWDAARMRAQIRNGSGRMRPISTARLSDEDLEKVVAWLGTIGAVR